MVGHQAVRIWKKRRADFLFDLKCDEPLVIFCGMKYVLPVVAACDQMIKPTFNIDPESSRHNRQILAENRRIADVTPFMACCFQEGSENTRDPVPSFISNKKTLSRPASHIFSLSWMYISAKIGVDGSEKTTDQVFPPF